MKMRSRNCSSMNHNFLIVLAIVLVCGAARVSEARVEILRWTHPNVAEIQRFEAQVGLQSGVYTETIDLGKPQADAEGIYSNSIDVGDQDSVFIVLVGIGTTGLSSMVSNEIQRSGSSTGGADTGSAGGSVTDPAGVNRFEFSEISADSDWLDTRSGNSMIEDDSLFTVVNVSGNPALSTSSPDQNIHSHLRGSSNYRSNVRIRGRMSIDTNTAGVGVTAYSQYPTSDIYYRLRRTEGNTFELAAHTTNTLTCSSSDTGVLPEVGSWYEFELTIENLPDRNRIRASVWKQGSQQPAVPQAECFDFAPTRPLGGTVGVWSMSSGQKFWDDLEIMPLSGSGLEGGSLTPPTPPILIDVVPVQ